MAAAGYRTKSDTELAPPLTPSGRCKFADLVKLVLPARTRRHTVIHDYYIPTSRRVQVGLVAGADVCLWHSLVACQRLHAHLVRDLRSP